MVDGGVGNVEEFGVGGPLVCRRWCRGLSFQSRCSLMELFQTKRRKQVGNPLKVWTEVRRGRTYCLKSKSGNCDGDEYYVFEHAGALLKSAWLMRDCWM